MTGKLTTGEILQGIITGIQPYGAFVALDEETQGLVHISEITHGFVKDIHEYLTVGDKVYVKVLHVDLEQDKVSLSIRAVKETPKEESKTPDKKENQQGKAMGGFHTLKDKLEEWIEQSKEQDSLSKK